VSLVDLTFVPGRETSAQEINDAIKAAASSGPLKGILAFTEEPLVSIDFNHNPASSTVDLKATKALEGKLVRVASWYDNEWGFSNRMCDTAALMASL
jgi:glyceraldehyde 3-phosphate dehydrogenase